MRNKIHFYTALTVMFACNGLFAQDNTRVFFTTGAGIIKSPGALSKVIQPSIALNSGIEVTGRQNWFVQGTLDFNTVKYHQRIKADGSPFLFQNTNSSLFMAALNGGRNFNFGDNKWFSSLYTGGGYLNIGEPRLILHSENTIRQQVSRKGGVFGKVGVRVGYKTKIKLLQTIYFDGSYWKSSVRLQNAHLNVISLFIGTRMSMK